MKREKCREKRVGPGVTGDGGNEKKANSGGVKTCRNLQRGKQKPCLGVPVEASSSLHLQRSLLLQPFTLAEIFLSFLGVKLRVGLAAGVYEVRGCSVVALVRWGMGWWWVVRSQATYSSGVVVARRGDGGEGRGIDWSCADSAKHSFFSCYSV